MKLPQYFLNSLMSFRNYLSYLNERIRFIDNQERFVVFASFPVTIPGADILQFNTVQGSTNDIVLTHMFNVLVDGTTRSFMFNMQITGSQEWFFSSPMWSSVFFWKMYPIYFPKPILLKSGSGMTFDITNVGAGAINVQFVFGGYKTGSKEV
jgi:hypothetical protein